MGVDVSGKGARLEYLTRKDLRTQKKYVVKANVYRNIRKVTNQKFVYYLGVQSEGMLYEFCTSEFPAPFQQGDAIEIHLSRYSRRILKICRVTS